MTEMRTRKQNDQPITTCHAIKIILLPLFEEDDKECLSYSLQLNEISYIIFVYTFAFSHNKARTHMCRAREHGNMRGCTQSLVHTDNGKFFYHSYRQIQSKSTHSEGSNPKVSQFIIKVALPYHKTVSHKTALIIMYN